MRETSKLAEYRKVVGHDQLYLKGEGIDIGCGADPLVTEYGSVVKWDMQDGDAMLMESVRDDVFDFVYSSHCLEHVVDVAETLRNWVRIVKPGGFLYVVVPDWILYEKETWPSMFNSDHKHTFSGEVSRETVGRENHWRIEDDVRDVLESVGAELVEVELQDNNYRYDWPASVDQTMGNATAQVLFVAKKNEVTNG